MNDNDDLKKDTDDNNEDVVDVSTDDKRIARKNAGKIARKERKRKAEEKDKLMDEINDAINRLAEENGLDPNKVRILSIKGNRVDFKSALFSFLTIIIFDFALFFAFSAIFEWATYNSKIDLLFFVLFFVGCEICLKLASIPLYNLCIRKNILLVPVIGILPIAITGLFCGVMPVFITIEKFYLYILIIALIYATKRFYVKYFMEKVLTKFFIRRRKKQKNNK